jgi:hypothetical protein
VPGVLSGSKGPLYYPRDEVERSVNAWNGMPLVVYHPTVAGEHVSAAHPGVLEKQGIGEVRRTAFNGKLRAEGWFDEERTRAIDPRVHARLLKNDPIELSTGLYTDNKPANSGAHFHGRTYAYTAHNYRPDHVAVLPDQVGACSLRDGCGVGVVNEANFVSEAQRRFMWSQHPDIAHAWAYGEHTSEGPHRMPRSSEPDGTAVNYDPEQLRDIRGMWAAKAAAMVDKLHSWKLSAEQIHQIATLNPAGALGTVKVPDTLDAKQTAHVQRVLGSAEHVDASHIKLPTGTASAASKAGYASHVAEQESSSTAHRAAAKAHEAAAGAASDEATAKAHRSAAYYHHGAAAKLQLTGNMPVNSKGEVIDKDQRLSLWQHLGRLLGFDASAPARLVGTQTTPDGRYVEPVVPVPPAGLAGVCQECGGDVERGVCIACGATANAAGSGEQTSPARVSPGAGAEAVSSVLDAICEHCGGEMVGGKCDACGATANCACGGSCERCSQESAAWLLYNREWPQAKRDKLPAWSFAGPDQSFPIETQEDLDNAVRAIGRTKHDPDRIRRGIRRIAERRNLELPDTWNYFDPSTYEVPNAPGYGDTYEDVSQRAAAASQQAGGSEALQEARMAMEGGDGAADHHARAADIHTKSAQLARRHGKPDPATSHEQAAFLHRKAANMVTANAWTDEAREAAAAAKAANAKAQKGGGKHSADPAEAALAHHLSTQAVAASQKAVHSGTEADHKEAVELHFRALGAALSAADSAPRGSTARKLFNASANAHGAARAPHLQLEEWAPSGGVPRMRNVTRKTGSDAPSPDFSAPMRTRNQRGGTMTRDRAIDLLIANGVVCEGDRNALKALSDRALTGLAAKHVANARRRSADDDDDDDDDGSSMDSSSMMSSELEACAGEPHSFDGPPVQASSVQAGGKGVRDEYAHNRRMPLEKRLTPEELAVWNYAKKAEENERLAIVRQLVMNVDDAKERNKLGNELMRKPREELLKLLRLVPAAPPAVYAGDPAIAVNSDQFENADVLRLPSCNYAEWANLPAKLAR